ncbi:MAG: DMT family transporter [Oscillospiraceae bacterium]|nr:DMT family transporter [Oscillospiraceae bacterium]
MKKQTFANLMMLGGAVIWGAAFVAQSIGADHVGPFAFGGIRFLLGALVVLPVQRLRDRKKPRGWDKAPTWEYVRAGGICGAVLFAAAAFQQYGVGRTTVGKAGFVTALYIILVPLFAFALYRRRLGGRVIAAAATAVAGIYLLCMTSGTFSVSTGDVYVFIGSVFWAVQILMIERFTADLDGLKFAFAQFISCAAINLVCMALFERPALSDILAAAPALLYCGLLSVGVAFTIQAVFMKYTEPTVASLMMSAESVFSAIFGFLILHETLTARQLFGCVLVFCAVVLAQLPQRRDARPAAPAQM